MSFELEGKIKVIKETMTFDSGFRKREFVVVTQQQYPQEIPFELINDRIDLIEGFKEGDPIKVHFDIRGREYQGRHFVNLTAWKVENPGGASAPLPGDAPLPDEPDIISGDDDDEDLPF